MRKLTKPTALLVAFVMAISMANFTVFAEISEDVQNVTDALTAEMLTVDNEPECSVTKNLNLDISEDITLPDGVTITFKSSNENVIANDGTVKRNSSVKKDVTLTATVSKSGSESVSKELKFTVLPLSSEVISSDNAYYPELLDKDIVALSGTAYAPVNPKWTFSNCTAAFVENILFAKYSKAENGTYNVTSTRKNLNTTNPTDGYVKYTDPQMPDVIQTTEKDGVRVKINFNPVSWGSTTAKQLYLRMYGRINTTDRTLFYVQFLETSTRLIDPSNNSTVLATANKAIKINQNNTLEVKLDYEKDECYLWLNDEPINTTGVKFPSAAAGITRQLDSIHFGYLRSMKDSVLQINDVTVTRETSYKVSSLSELTSEIIADGQNPDFITNSLNLPANEDITWESSNTSVIANDGTVTRPVMEDETITMTASDGINTKTLEFTVKSETVTAVAENSTFTDPFFGQFDKGDELPLFTQNESAKTTFNYADGRYFAEFNSSADSESVFSADTTSFSIGSSGKYIFEFDAAYNNAGNAMFKFLGDNKTAICLNNNVGNIKISNSATDEWNNTDNKTYATVTADEWNRYKVVINTLAEVPCASIYTNETPLVEDMTLLNYSFDQSIGFAICSKGTTSVKLDNLVLYTENSSDDIGGLPNSAKATFISKLITYSSITDDNYYDLQSDLDLETLFAEYDFSDLGVNVAWSSSQSQVISESGKVTRQENNRYVVMTATVTAGSGDDAVTVIKELPFTVAAADSSIHASFAETFEYDAIGDNAGWTFGADATPAVTEIDGRSGKVLEMTFTNNPGFARQRITDNGTLDNRYFVSADVFFAPDSASSKQYIELMGPGATARIGFDFARKTVSMHDSNGDRFYAVPFTDINTNTWYHIDIDFNAAKKNYMVYVNGYPLAAEYVDITDTAWVNRQYLRYFGIYSYGTGKAYVDNVIIRQSNAPAPVYDENRDYTIRSVSLTNANGVTITNPAHDATSVKAKVKIIKNRTPVEGASEVFFARYDTSGKLQQVVSEIIDTKAPGYEVNGQILNVEMPLTGDCSDHRFKIFVISPALVPYCEALDSHSPIFDTERLFNKPANATLTSELGYYPTSLYEGIDTILYDGDTYKGRQVKHFAYIGLPEGASAENPVPAVVCVHGGQGTAFEEWVKVWNEKGYAAIAMDLNGEYPTEFTSFGNYPRHAWSGASQDNYSNVSPHDSGWMYGAVTAVIGAHNVLREMPEVDNNKIGIAGISWGGVITSTAIGVDNRFAFAIPSFGCGYLYESETWMADYMTEEKLLWEPSNFIAKATMPILWMNGDKDTAFSITSTSKSSLCGGDNSYTAIIPGYNHGNQTTWSRTEPYAFADSIVNGGQTLIRGTAVQNENTVVATTDRAAAKATLRYMTVEKLYFEEGTSATYDVETVTTTDANTDTFTFTLPSDATMFYVTFTDADGNNTSTVLYNVE